MGPLQFDPGLFVWSLVTFTVLVLVLARFAFRPLNKILQERERRIRSSLEKADEARVSAEDLVRRNEEQMNKARDETRHIINEGHRIVADMKKEAREGAQKDADLIVSQARTEIDRQLRQSLDELKGTVANLSLRIARQVIRGELNEKRHEELAQDFVERLKKTHGTPQS